MQRPIRGLTHDSRAVEKDWIFVALPGKRHDGHRFVPGLAQAAAVVVEREVAVPAGVTCLRVVDSRRALPHLAAAFYGHPGRRLPVVGVTGTNGKTTVTRLAAAALQGASVTAGVVGTAGHLAGSGVVDSHSILGAAAPAHHHTTPEAPVLQALLAHMAASSCAAVLMEVSSIGLHAHRADGIPFAVAAFTNLTRDHLDYHGSFEAYARAKERLFHELLAHEGTALLCCDDPAWRRFRPQGRTCWTYGIQRGDLRLEDLSLDAQGSSARVHTPVGSGRLRLPLVGRHNLSNALCALGISLALGADLQQALVGLSRASVVPGRLEAVPNQRGIAVFVDYAHTPDALRQVLASLAELSSARLITVFGCGGDRDRGKRPEMGAVARAGSQLVVVTSDNPRSEDPLAIIDEVLAGIDGYPGDEGVSVEVDREAAIRLALSLARPGDLILVAGKGHETGQELADRVVPFDDRLVARSLLGEQA